MSTTPDPQDPWKAGSFEGCRIAQTEEIARRPFIERLRWACEMSELIRLKCLNEGKMPPALREDRYS